MARPATWADKRYGSRRVCAAEQLLPLGAAHPPMLGLAALSVACGEWADLLACIACAGVPRPGAPAGASGVEVCRRACRVQVRVASLAWHIIIILQKKVY